MFGGTCCGALPGNTNDTDPDAVELRVGYQQDTSEGIVTTALAKAFVEEQAALGKKVKVTPIGIPAGSYNDTVLRMYNGETLPDVVTTTPRCGRKTACSKNSIPILPKTNSTFRCTIPKPSKRRGCIRIPSITLPGSTIIPSYSSIRR